MTLVAWSNSIGDYLSCTMFAKRNIASTAVAGIFSGQLFNFLIGFGASLVIQSIDG
jgi:Ca2+/Na+ antiporter